MELPIEAYDVLIDMLHEEARERAERLGEPFDD
jgi:hypothetical protein